MDDYQNLKISALFHDIGKFYQRTNFIENDDVNLLRYDDKNMSNNIKLSANFAKNYFSEVIEDMILHQNDPPNSSNKRLCEIIQKAKSHSFPYEIDLGSENSNIPLTSIFSKVTLDKNLPNEYYVPLAKLTLDKSIFPKKYDLNNELDLDLKYSDLWKNFMIEFSLQKNVDFETSLALLKKYAFSIPYIACKGYNDISLYDYLKTTVALSNCLFLYSNQDKSSDKEYLIVNGDISGIQNFIYKISSPNEAQSGMSKRLRGRSLYISLLTEAIVDKLIYELNLDSSNIIFCGGGRFIIIAPNTNESKKIIENIDLEVNKFFINKFNAELYLALVSISVTGADLNCFDNIISDLSSLLNKNKKNKFKNQLDNIFEIETSAPYSTCLVCGNPTQNKHELCKECKKHEKLGQKVANAKYLVKCINEKNVSEFKIFKTNFIFFDDENGLVDFVNSENIKMIVYKLNDSNISELFKKINNDNVSFDFRFMGNIIPKIGHTPLYFNHLAQLSKGSNKLGILKMDVDNLGKIFSNGFEKIDGANLSKISSLSFYMDLFFAGYINKIASNFKFYTNIAGFDNSFILKKLEFINENTGEISTKTVYKAKGNLDDKCLKFGMSTIYINYSGGDDLLVIGPYDDIIEFSQKFRNQFKEWTTNNNSINISGGIFISNPKFPIGKGVHFADVELDKSKNFGKNMISVFGETLKWDSDGRKKGFDEIFEFSKFLESKVNNGISKSFVYSLLNIWKNHHNPRIKHISDAKDWEYDNTNRMTDKNYIRFFKYKLRLVKNEKLREEIDKKGCKYMPWIKTPVSWVSLRLR